MMNGLQARLASGGAWWAARTARERIMLAVMGAALGAFLAWFILITPLLAWRAGASERLERAAETRALAAAASRLGAPGDSSRPLTEVLALAEAAAGTAGVEVRLRVEEDGVSFAVESAETAALFAWIAALERTHGLTVSSLSVVENADATLQAQGELAG